ncbi:GntR family transcriptional regulator [Alkalicoccobacillus porphyridii]|uniref:GntR family transcriptional regulator n=1 Tax=Alkalicoccobacillus porphyridii TaxID=2597270 RepID=A0A553ZZ25_9BACI|nr:GntR family transcriptional regulator [Alkalicoccobacillus porphyridii]TSB46655.1 GntR family transcriptional regulator [Alkalicoccobacillus porphyridii]
MNLNRKTGPLYIQVKNILKERILNQDYPIHSLIPPESQLEKEFNVSKITIRKAVELLAQEGYVDKKIGYGTVVLNNAAFNNMSTGQNFSSFLLKEGKQLTKKVISVSQINTPTEIVTETTVKTCTLIERLYYLDEEPYIYMIHYIPLPVELPLELEYYAQSLYDALRKSGATFNQFRDEFTISLPPDSVKTHLNINQEVLLKRTRFAYDLNESLIEYSHAFYLTSKQSYVIDFTV